MSETTQKLLKLISEGYTLNQISNEINISPKKIFNILTMIKNKGFDFNRKYYETGDIIYEPIMSINNLLDNQINIITDKKSTCFTYLVFSDLHVGSSFENKNILDVLFEYAIKHGIHNLICSGDLTDGTFSKSEQRIKKPYEQIDEFLKIYPYDKSILTFTVLGDHDYSILQNTGQDIGSVLSNYRHDIVSLGYGTGMLNIKDDNIVVKHPCSGIMKNDYKTNIVLSGHQHFYKVDCFAKVLNVAVPSVSKLSFTSDKDERTANGFPSAVLMNIIFNNNIISEVYLTQLIIVNNKIYSVNDIHYQLQSYQKGNYGNVEDLTRVLKK